MKIRETADSPPPKTAPPQDRPLKTALAAELDGLVLNSGRVSLDLFRTAPDRQRIRENDSGLVRLSRDS